MFLHWRMWIFIAGNANITATRLSINFQVTFIGVLQSIQKYLLLSEHCHDWIPSFWQGCCRGAYATPLYICACDDAAMRVCSYSRVTASYTTWQIGHTTLHSHAVRARDRPSSVLRYQPLTLGYSRNSLTEGSYGRTPHVRSS